MIHLRIHYTWCKIAFCYYYCTLFLSYSCFVLFYFAPPLPLIFYFQCFPFTLASWVIAVNTVFILYVSILVLFVLLCFVVICDWSLSVDINLAYSNLLCKSEFKYSLCWLFMLCCVMLCYVVLCCVLYVVLCCVMLCCVMLLCCVVLCCVVMLCCVLYVVLCYVVLCSICCVLLCCYVMLCN